MKNLTDFIFYSQSFGVPINLVRKTSLVEVEKVRLYVGTFDVYVLAHVASRISTSPSIRHPGILRIYSQTPIKRTPLGPRLGVRLIGVSAW